MVRTAWLRTLRFLGLQAVLGAFEKSKLENGVIVSATNRGGKRSEADFYRTPPETTQAILKHLELPGGHWLEPCAGDGAIIEAVQRPDVIWTAAELRTEMVPVLWRTPGVARVLSGDFLQIEIPGSGMPDHPNYSVAALNPPFSLALDFIERCLEVSDWVLALERLNFLGSIKRNSFWRHHMPNVYVLPHRPAFRGRTKDGKKGTDSVEYCWFAWPPGMHNRSWGDIEVLPADPKLDL